MQFSKPAHLLLLLAVSSQAHTASAYDCFGADGTALKTEVNAYTANPSGYSNSKYGPIDQWCTTPVTTMRDLFYLKGSFNANITAWDTSSVTDMNSMFGGASAFNQDLSAWDTSSVTDMSRMFQYADAFNANITAWDTSSVTNMNAMFLDANAFNQNLSAWNTSSVTGMAYMFYRASAFNQNLCAWKDNFPYSSAADIFVGTGCTYKSVPVESDQGPFCAGSAEECKAYTAVTPVPTNSPTKSPTNSPTKSPTNSPTKSPTNSPTNSPNHGVKELKKTNVVMRFSFIFKQTEFTRTALLR